MPPFEGFTSSETFIPIPDVLFRLLGEMDDINEIKLTLYVLWRVEHMEGAFRVLRVSDILQDEDFMQALDEENVESGLERAVWRGTLLRVEKPTETYYVLNSPRGRACVDTMQRNDWRDTGGNYLPPLETPNIFKMYEENIGPLTPLVADILRDAEKLYSAEWIGDAIQLAIKSNVRNWKYVEAILRRWKEEGRAEKQDRRNNQESRGRDVSRKVDEFLKRKR